MSVTTNWAAQTQINTNWTPQTTNTTNFGLTYSSSSLYDSSTDNYDGTTLTIADVDFFYDGAFPLGGASTNWTAA